MPISTQKCDKCKWEYPDYYLNEMFVGSGYTKPICGICALDISNEGLPDILKRAEFSGEIAEDLRLAAKDWRRKHPELKPE